MKSPSRLGDRHSEVATARRELRLVQRLMHEMADGEPIPDVVALSGLRRGATHGAAVDRGPLTARSGPSRTLSKCEWSQAQVRTIQWPPRTFLAEDTMPSRGLQSKFAQGLVMTNHSDVVNIKAQLDRLTTEFFLAVSFEEGATPNYENIYELFIESGLLVKNTGSTPEINTVRQFIEPRQVAVRNGELTRFHEIELCETTEIFGNVAHRFNSYAKSGTIKGVPFTARGMVSTQFIKTTAGWKISAMAWDDERPGLSIPERYDQGATRR